ncbi:MAG: hypothetical protein KIT83_22555, partial [Bryobacterales bacterium]|nr:hypothetical protein [Bryobacterales bacterium]
MSVRLLRGDPGGIMDFRWQVTGGTDGRTVDGNAVGGRTVDVRTGKGIWADTFGTRPEQGATESTRMSFEQQLDAARREVAGIREQRESEVREAFQQGVEEGRRLANDAARVELDAVQGRLAQSLSELARARQDVLAQTDTDLVHLSVAIAEKVLNRQLQMDADAMRGIARAALERIAGRPVHAVRAHPEDLDALRQELSGAETKGLRLVADASLGRGSLLFETEHGTLDCSIATQLEEIERGLVDR